LGLTNEEFARRARVAYVKVAEYQARGGVHFHAVFRLDGRDPADPGAVLPPPDGGSVELLERAIREAATHARVLVPPFASVPARAARWGQQLDLRVIRPAGEDSEELSADRVASHIAKYATKGTEGLGAALDRRIHNRAEVERLDVPEHVRELVAACWDLGGRPELRSLRLRQWAHMLGFRGHFATKSRRYSTTFGQLRRARVLHAARRRHGEAAWLDEWGRLLPSPDAVLVASWEFVGRGYRTPADAELAASLAAWAREQRQTARDELAATRGRAGRTSR
jgi:Replication initiator protein, pSAM2